MTIGDDVALDEGNQQDQGANLLCQHTENTMLFSPILINPDYVHASPRWWIAAMLGWLD